MLSLTRIAQFHGYLYEALGEDKQRTLVRLEHKIAVSVATYGKDVDDMVQRTNVLNDIVDKFFVARFHEHLMIRANEPMSANHYMQNRQEFKGLYISSGDNSALSLSAELLHSKLYEELLDEGFLLYRILVRRSDQDAQYTTLDLEQAIATYGYSVESGAADSAERLRQMLRPIGEDMPASKGRSKHFKGRSCALRPGDKRLF